MTPETLTRLSPEQECPHPELIHEFSDLVSPICLALDVRLPMEKATSRGFSTHNSSPATAISQTKRQPAKQAAATA